MCNLYRLRASRAEMAAHFRAMDDLRNAHVIDKDYAAPGKPGVVIRVEGGERVLSTMRWGFPTRKPRKRPAKEGELPFLHDWRTNCRNMGHSMWRPSLLEPAHRCLVPFTEFSEPKATADRAGPGDTAWWFGVTD